MNKPKTTQTNPSSTTPVPASRPKPGARPEGGRAYVNPLDYEHHPYPSMEDFARLLTLRHDANRTRHCYYRDLRLIHEHFGCDPATLKEQQLRDYILHVKTVKNWKPKTIRQTAASARVFFVEMLGHEDWRIFGQIRTRDHDELPAILTRPQVHALLEHVRLRRYRIPLKLIYCCGLRLSECLGLTVHDILGDERKLWIRSSKNHRDRLVPLPEVMVEDLRGYWSFHRNPLLIFPHVGRGRQKGEALRLRMREATRPMPYSSLQRLVLQARKELNLPGATVHTLRHCFGTHLVEAGASLHTVQKLLGHKQINSTMVYLHLTHHSEQDALKLLNQLCEGLPR